MSFQTAIEGKTEVHELIQNNTAHLTVVDKWILTKLQKLIKHTTESMDNYTFSMVELENFIWHEFADYYLEMVKYRTYSSETSEQGTRTRLANKTERSESPASVSSAKVYDKSAAIWTMYNVILNAIKLLAPFAPFITEDIYQNIFRKYEKEVSVHILKWPEEEKNFLDENAEKLGDMAIDIIAKVRQFKSDNKLSMNAPLKELMISAEHKELTELAEDLRGTLKIETIRFGYTDGIATEKFKIGLEIVK